MSVFKKTLFLSIFLLLTAVLQGGDLAVLSKDLDFIEYSFAHAALQPSTSENRKNVEQRLNNFYSKLLIFLKKLQAQRVPKIPNFLEPANRLNLVFKNLGYTTTTARLPRNRGTSLGNYSRTYNEYLRDINRLEGKKGKSRQTTPTLKTIPLANYRAWLDRVTQDYIQSLRKISKSSNSTNSRKRSKSRNRNSNYLSTNTINLLEEYAVSVAKLRLYFAIIAQNKFYKE